MELKDQDDHRYGDDVEARRIHYMELKASISILLLHMISEIVNPLHGVESSRADVASTGYTTGIHYMELKDPLPAPSKPGARGGIHYMELKGPGQGEEAHRVPSERIHYMELKVQQELPLDLAVEPRIHYMELKGLPQPRAYYWEIPRNPLHGVERAITTSSPSASLSYPESITWS